MLTTSSIDLTLALRPFSDHNQIRYTPVQHISKPFAGEVDSKLAAILAGKRR